MPEQRATELTTLTATSGPPEESDFLLRFSSLKRLLHVTAWCLRWRRAPERPTTTGGQPSDDILSTGELKRAHYVWVRTTQACWFGAEMTTVAAQRPVHHKSPLKKLAPLLDQQEILWVGGRLQRAMLSHDQKHPIILPAESHFTTLVIRAFHQRALHSGVQMTLGLLRKQYWVPRRRTLVKRLIHRCTACVRWRAETPWQLMESLPGPRVTPSRPFAITGVDYAGPVLLRTTKGRGHKAYKAFLAIFVCFSTQAVHVEVVSDYSTEAFLAAFRRFMSRRGLCCDVYSDCGTNFVGADNQLRALFRAATSEGRSITTQLANDGVRWHFNPPAAPHFGGLWEAAVKSIKHHLRRVLGDATLTFEEMSTLLAQIEAMLNSRLLQALSDDPEDLGALTPGHFLVGGPLSAILEPSLVDEPRGRLRCWQLVQQMREHVWQRWSQEYLQGLQARSKWWREGAILQVGNLCLIRHDATPPTKWPLARVTKVHPGDDGRIRVATVRTATMELTRPVAKLVLLPIGKAESR